MQNKNNIYDIEFLNSWTSYILFLLFKSKKNRKLYENKIAQLESCYLNKDGRKMRDLYKSVYSMAITSDDILVTSLNKELKSKYKKILTDLPPRVSKVIQLSIEKQKRIDFIKNWCLQILEFLNSKADGFGNNPIPAMINTLLICHAKPNSETTKGMEKMYKDISEWADVLNLKEQEELNNILIDKFNLSLNDVKYDFENGINNIIKRGNIKNDVEFQFLEKRASELSQTRPNSDFIESLNNLLFEYHLKGRK